jgi:hypothetical protein
MNCGASHHKSSFGQTTAMMHDLRVCSHSGCPSTPLASVQGSASDNVSLGAVVLMFLERPQAVPALHKSSLLSPCSCHVLLLSWKPCPGTTPTSLGTRAGCTLLRVATYGYV